MLTKEETSAEMFSIILFVWFVFCVLLITCKLQLNFSGRPAPQKELTNEYNVLEAGLWNSISLNKGISVFFTKYLKRKMGG